MRFDFLRRRPTSPRLQRLRQLPLLAHLDFNELRHVDALLHERDYIANEIVFDEGEEGQALYIVLEGQLSVVRVREGEEVVLASLAPGDFFGEMALVDRGPRGARVRASANCRMAVLFREDLLALFATHAVIAAKITLEMARHLAQIVRQTSLPIERTITL